MVGIIKIKEKNAMLDRNLFHVGDLLTVQFNDENIPIEGIVERDSSGYLYLLFPDNTVAYSDFKILKQNTDALR